MDRQKNNHYSLSILTPAEALTILILKRRQIRLLLVLMKTLTVYKAQHLHEVENISSAMNI